MVDMSPKYNHDKPWWQNRGCQMRFQLSDRMGAVTGVLVRIDQNEYRKYVVVHIGGGNFEHINIDHIITVVPIVAPEEK